MLDVPSECESMTMFLLACGVGKDYVAIVVTSLSLNTKSEGYKIHGSSMVDKESIIRNEIFTVISSKSIDDMKNNIQDVQSEILERVQAQFGAVGKEFIVGIGFRSIQYQ